jgi:hypothetical protein
MKLLLKNGVTGLCLRVFLQDSAAADGSGKTGLTYQSAGLAIAAIADNESATTAYSGANVETIAALGTFGPPTAGKCGFREVDASSHPGVYEVHLANARWAVAAARSVLVTFKAAGAAVCHAEVQLGNSNALSLLEGNVDSTGAGAVTVRKAMEAMLAVLSGVASFDASTGQEVFKGRDGQTTIVANTLTGGGTRTRSTIN